MPTRRHPLKKLRTKAFIRQAGLCIYCGCKMWNSSPDELEGLTPRQATRRQCTGEHLVAHQDGGKATASNIAAACWACNQLRHSGKEALSPTEFEALVKARIAKGRRCEL
ncbi:HNH endonuclease [Pseudomonas tohonis]|nr:HNH endonuclease [Pseudomonas tohonis]